MRTTPLFLLLTLVGCARCQAPDEPAPEGDADADADSDTDSDADADADADSDADTDVQPPCADGTWAGWDSPAGVVWVAPHGTDLGDGSASDPLLSLTAAMQAIRGVEDARVGLWPGHWTVEVQLKRLDGGSLAMSGCSAEETVLAGNTAAEKGPVVSIIGPGSFTLRRLGTESGGSGVVVVGGAMATIEDVTVTRAAGRGINLVGEDTFGTLRRVEVRNTTSAYGRRPAGWGVGTRKAAAVLEDVTITDTVSFGVFADQGTVVASGLVVRDTITNGKGRHGVAVYANQLDTLTLTDCSLERSEGGGVFAVDVRNLTLTSCEIEGVGASMNAPGDGIVARRVGAWSGEHRVTLSNNAVRDATRLGIAVAGDIQLTLDDNVAGEDNGVVYEGSSIFAATGVSVNGTQAAQVLDADAYPLGRLFVGADGPRFTGGYP